MHDHSPSWNDRLLPSHHGLKVAWFDAWHPVLDEALDGLPEGEVCPRDLYRLLLQSAGLAPKRTALVTEHDEPVAVVGLRQKERRTWELVTQWATPGFIFPALPHYHLPALEALGIDVWVAWWRMQSPPPHSTQIRSMTTTQTYRLPLTGDYEHYWRENGYFKTVRRVRNRCRDLRLEINAPGAAEWTIRSWEAKWRGDCPIVDSSLPERLLVAEYLEKQGRHFTLTLADQGVRAGGATIMADGKNLVAGVSYRAPHYEHHGVGDRLIDLCFSFGAEHGFEVFDIGGGHEYKKHWARQDGEHYLFDICPEHVFRAKQATHWLREVRAAAVHQAGEPNRS